MRAGRPQCRAPPEFRGRTMSPRGASCVLLSRRVWQSPRVTASTSIGGERALDLARRALARLASPPPTLPARVLLIDVRRQRLVLIEDGQPIAEYPVST